MEIDSNRPTDSTDSVIFTRALHNCCPPLLPLVSLTPAAITFSGIFVVCGMTDGFRMQEGMFLVVPHQTTDRRVLRLKKLVQGYEISPYDPKPYFHFDQEVTRNGTRPGSKQHKGKTSDDGVGKACNSKSDQQPLVNQKKSASGIFVVCGMTDGFRMQEGMFLVVPHQTTDERVLRLKKLVQGYEICPYDPKPYFHFDQEVIRNAPRPGSKQHKGKTSDDDIVKTCCSKSVQQPLVNQKKSASVEHCEKRIRSSVAKSSEKLREETKSAANTANRNHTKYDTSRVSSGNSRTNSHQNTPTDSPREISIRNHPEHPSSNTSVSRRILVHPPSTALGSRDSCSRPTSRIHSKSSTHKILSMPDLSTILTADGNPMTSSRAGNTPVAKRHSIVSSEASNYRSSVARNHPAEVGTSTVHQSKATHQPSDSSGNRRSPVRYPSESSSSRCNFSVRRHPESVSGTPKSRKNLIPHVSTGVRLDSLDTASVLPVQRHSHPEKVGTSSNSFVRLSSDPSSVNRRGSAVLPILPSDNGCSTLREKTSESLAGALSNLSVQKRKRTKSQKSS